MQKITRWGFLSPHLQRKLHWETFREYVEVPYLRWCRSKRPVQKTRRTNGGGLYRAVFCLHNWGIFFCEVELKGDKRGQNMTKNQVLEGLCNTSFELYNCCLFRCHATKLKVRFWFSLDTFASLASYDIMLFNEALSLIPWTIGEISSMESKMSANTRRGSLVKYGYSRISIPSWSTWVLFFGWKNLKDLEASLTSTRLGEPHVV